MLLPVWIMSVRVGEWTSKRIVIITLNAVSSCWLHISKLTTFVCCPTETQIRAAVLQQEHYPPQLEEIFPPRSLLLLPDLTQIFPKQKRRFRKRTSSAQWGTPPSKVFRVSTSFTWGWLSIELQAVLNAEDSTTLGVCVVGNITHDMDRDGITASLG